MVSIALCITCEVLFLSLLFVTVVIAIIILYFVSVSELFLFQPASFIIFFLILLPTGEIKQVSHVILSWHMELNHNIWEGIRKSWDV